METRAALPEAFTYVRNSSLHSVRRIKCQPYHISRENTAKVRRHESSTALNIGNTQAGRVSERSWKLW
jgi:hypothetical protein